MVLQEAISQYSFAKYSIRELVLIVRKVIDKAKLVQHHQSMPIILAIHELGKMFAAAASYWHNVYAILGREQETHQHALSVSSKSGLVCHGFQSSGSVFRSEFI